MFPVLWFLWVTCLGRGDLHRARALGERLFSLARRAQTSELLLGAHTAMGMTLLFLGELASALTSAAIFHQLCREADTTQDHAEALVALASEHGFALRLAHGTILLGWVQATQGEAKAGIAQMQQALCDWQATGGRLGHPYFLVLLVEAYGKARAVEDGLKVVAKALAIISITGERLLEADLHRLQGELRLQQAIPDERQAEGCFEQALVIARRQQAKTLELRAAISLSRLWQHQGKGREAHQLLAETYGWFAEGFDTADLQEARALLEELS